MATMFKVQDGVPVPEIKRASKQRRKFPVETMAVGQMFFVPGRTTKSISAYIARITKNLAGKWVTRHCWAWEDKRTGDWTVCEHTAVGAVEGAGVWRTE